MDAGQKKYPLVTVFMAIFGLLLGVSSLFALDNHQEESGGIGLISAIVIVFASYFVWKIPKTTS